MNSPFSWHFLAIALARPAGDLGFANGSLAGVGEANSTPTMSPTPRISRMCGPTAGSDLNSSREVNSSFDLVVLDKSKNKRLPLAGIIRTRTEPERYRESSPLSLRPQRPTQQRTQQRYPRTCQQTRLFSKKWLETKGLAHAIPAELQKYVVLP